MGVECPECHTHQAIVHNITADGKPATKPGDILARRLACGHVLGSEKYNEYVSRVQAIEIEKAAKVRDLEDEAASKKAGLWKGLASSGKVM